MRSALDASSACACATTSNVWGLYSLPHWSSRRSCIRWAGRTRWTPTRRAWVCTTLIASGADSVSLAVFLVRLRPRTRSRMCRSRWSKARRWLRCSRPRRASGSQKVWECQSGKAQRPKRLKHCESWDSTTSSTCSGQPIYAFWRTQKRSLLRAAVGTVRSSPAVAPAGSVSPRSVIPVSSRRSVPRAAPAESWRVLWSASFRRW